MDGSILATQSFFKLPAAPWHHNTRKLDEHDANCKVSKERIFGSMGILPSSILNLKTTHMLNISKTCAIDTSITNKPGDWQHHGKMTER